MKPQVKRIHSPDVGDLESYAPDDPSRIGVLIQIMVGPAGRDGEEAFDLVVCTPQWLSTQIAGMRVLNLRHHLLVDTWSWPAVVDYIEQSLASIDASTWQEVAALVGRLGKWEFEDYDGQ